MRNSILLLNDRFGNSGETENYILHFSEWFTHLGYRITVGCGGKTPHDFTSPIISDFTNPALDGGGSEAGFALHALEEQLRESAPSLVFFQNVFDWRVIEGAQRALPEIPFVWFAHRRFFDLMDAIDPPPGRARQESLLDLVEGGACAAPGAGPLPDEDAILPGAEELMQRFLDSAAVFDRIVVSREERKARLARRIPGATRRIQVLPGGPGLTPPEEGEGGVLYAGLIGEEMGTLQLIEAMERVRHVPSPRLWIAGTAPDPAYLDHCRAAAESVQAGRYDLEIEFWIDPAPDILERLYRQATVFALPSLRPVPFPVAAQEALEHGLPVVAFDLGGVDTLVRDRETGLLVRPGDLRALAGKLEWLLAHHQDALRMGRSAHELASWEFHSRDQVTALNRVFDDLLFRGRSGRSARGLELRA